MNFDGCGEDVAVAVNVVEDEAVEVDDVPCWHPPRLGSSVCPFDVP
jgi:hypothetical protein